MLSKLQKSNNRGFTIVEVMIVLAIAGLIMLIVFLAVPALQRGQRNSSRKSEASRVASAINDYTSNNQGSLPRSDSDAHWATDCGKVMSSVGTLSQFSGLSCNKHAVTAMSNDKFDVGTGAMAPVGTGSLSQGHDSMVLDEQAQCAGNDTTSAGTTRQAALFYTVETSGVPSVACINVE